MSARTAVVACLAASGVLVAAGSAAAAPASSGAPRVAHTTQTQYFHGLKSGGYKRSVPIVFAGKTFSVPEFGDTGTFHNVGDKLTLTVHHSTIGDSGCVFTAGYHATSTNYAGRFTCPGGFSDTFAVTTTGT